MIRILIVEDERYVAESLDALFTHEGMEAVVCATAEAALDAPPCDVVLADLKLPGMSGVDLLARLKERDPALPVLILTGHGAISDAVAAMRGGALDFLTKPADPEVIVERVRKAAEHGRLLRERDRLRGHVDIVAESAAMREVLAWIDRVADQPAPVLIRGETGTGKERVAALLHERSARRDGPLVKVPCGAVPPTLFEVEFFGSEKGAYSGAHRARPGYLVEADGGTLFLDEVAALPADAQVKLLRALERGEVRPVGATRTRRVDVRVVAATNEDLEELRDGGRFRPDLYYRLAGFPVELPPLRERPEDVVALARSFADPLELTAQAERVLRAHRWPGNAHELRNVIARARVATEGGAIDATHLEELISTAEAGRDLDLKRRTRELERELFREALRRAGGVKSEAARLLGIDPSNWSYHQKRLKRI